jgi:hypothetical protein
VRLAIKRGTKHSSGQVGHRDRRALVGNSLRARGLIVTALSLLPSDLAILRHQTYQPTLIATKPPSSEKSWRLNLNSAGNALKLIR